MPISFKYVLFAGMKKLEVGKSNLKDISDPKHAASAIKSMLADGMTGVSLKQVM